MCEGRGSIIIALRTQQHTIKCELNRGKSDRVMIRLGTTPLLEACLLADSRPTMVHLMGAVPSVAPQQEGNAVAEREVDCGKK